MRIRPAIPSDDEAPGGIITPIIRAGETYALPSDWMETEALAYWGSAARMATVKAVGFVEPRSRADRG
jgi:hypothetical protein